MPVDDDSKRRIRTIANTYSAEVKRIQANSDLSPTGKQRALAALRHRRQTEIDTIKSQANEVYVSHRAKLERELFGIHDIPNDIAASINWRDAVDRVSGLKTGADAQLMLRRAIRHGDGLLCRAIADRAWEMAGSIMNGTGWGEVIGEYFNQVRPDLADKAEELATLQRIDNKAGRLNDQIETSLFTPPELAAMSPGDRRQVEAAAAAETAAGLTPGGGTSQAQTAQQAFGQFARESSEGAYGA